MSLGDTSKITIGVTCYNRHSYFYQTIASLSNSGPFYEVIIYDDASTTIDHRFTLKELPNAKIYRANINSGRADYAMYRLMRLFLEKSAGDFFVLMDSDLLASAHLGKKLQILAGDPVHEGVFSIFNTPSHPGVPIADGWLSKEHIGGAGSVFSRTIIQNITDNVPPSSQYDWDWSRHLKSLGIRIACTVESHVQHLGLSAGQNSSLVVGDYGVNYTFTDLAQVSLLSEEFVRIMQQTRLKQIFLERKIAELEQKLLTKA